MRSRVVPVLAAVLAMLLGVAVPAVGQAPSLVDRQWGLGQIRAGEAHEVTRGAGATIAIVDSGLDLDHPEFAGRIAGGATFTGCPSAPDGCGDGSVASGDDPSPSDHGTHVAGIAAAADDGHGTVGVAPDASLLAVKVLARDELGNVSGTAAEIAAGIRWATRNGADVINLSLGEPPGAQALHLTGLASLVDDAVAEAVAAGVVVVGAAGNEFAVPACDEPAFDPQVLCVVATDRHEDRATYSNFGVDQGLNVVAAPGGAAFLSCADDVLSTLRSGFSDGGCPDVPTGYGYLAGTSMAAPHVSGVAALLVSQGLGAQQVVDTIVDTARDPVTGARGSYTPTYGYGIVDAAAAVGELPSTVVTRHAGDDRVATAAAISRAAHPDGADVVVLARADDYADALAGAPLAAHRGGPLLLTARTELSAAAATEVDRLGASTAYLLGGRQALSEDVADALRDRGLQVRRIAGATRFATAVEISRELPASDRVYVVEGADPDPARGWPDALSASGLASVFREPILLTTTDVLPSETAAAVGSDTDVVIVGGTVSVSTDVEQRLRARAATVRRLAGGDRYETSVAVVEEARRRGAGTATLWLATGRAYPDGLAAGAATGAAGGLFALVDGQDLDRSPATRELLAANADQLRAVRLAGGRAAITADTERAIRNLVT